MFHSNYKLFIILTAIFIAFFSLNTFAQFDGKITLSPVSAQHDSGEKPQSKVWYYGGYWWTVIPVSTGTYIYRLDGSTWTQTLELSSSSDYKADTKAVGNVVHILLHNRINRSSADLISVEYDATTTPPTYKLWTTRQTTVTINFISSAETVTIDIDNTGRMWLAHEASTDINVYSSDSPYSTWIAPTVLHTGVKSDDICAVTAFGGNKIGVLWSNQTAKQFQFKYHLDSESDATIWSTMEIASPGQSGSFADDHINFAVSGGTIYAAVKTSYSDGPSNTTVALLERTGINTWNVYSVTNSAATRPIALLDDTNNKIYVLYTTNYGTSDSDIDYKWSTTTNISFSSAINLTSGSFNDVTSTKQNFTNEVVILYATSSDEWNGVKTEMTPVPVELAYFSGTVNGNKVELRWRTETEVNNYGFNIESRVPLNPSQGGEDGDWITIAFVEGHGNSNSPKYYDYTDSYITLAGRYKYRLKQIDNDGTFEYSNVVTVDVVTPNNFYLSQNYPNPFNPVTRIDFTIPERQHLSLRVYNTLGELMTELVNEIKEPGSYSVTFDASILPGGIYFYRLSAGKYSIAKKMSLLK